MTTIVITAIISVVVTLVSYILVTTYITKNTIQKQRAAALKEAEAEGEMIKKEKILQAKEKFIQLKSEHDRTINERNQRIAQSEQRAKQIETNLQNQQRDLENKLKENDRLKEQMNSQLQSLNTKKEELAAVIKEQNVRLEQISGEGAGLPYLCKRAEYSLLHNREGICAGRCGSASYTLPGLYRGSGDKEYKWRQVR